MRCVEMSSQQIGHDQKLRHRLRRAAGFGDDVEAGPVHVDHVQKRVHALGIDVVLNEQPRAAALFLWQIIVVQMRKRLLHRDRTQRAAADAEHDEVVELCAHIRRNRFDLIHDLVLIVRELAPLHLSALFLHCLCRRLERKRKELVLCESARTERFLHHVVVIHRDPHRFAIERLLFHIHASL